MVTSKKAGRRHRVAVDETPLTVFERLYLLYGSMIERLTFATIDDARAAWFNHRDEVVA